MSTEATPQRALICEDDGITVMQLRRALSQAGYEIAGEAVSGAIAIELVKQTKPNLVLMDINMPGSVDGIAATREILHTEQVPVIMLTAYSDDSYVDAALDAGACGYLVKPITSDQLLVAIRTATARFHALQAALKESTDGAEALETRKLIEGAKGALMARRHLSESEAFNTIRAMSRSAEQTMKQTALDILSGRNEA